MLNGFTMITNKKKFMKNMVHINFIFMGVRVKTTDQWLNSRDDTILIGTVQL